MIFSIKNKIQAFYLKTNKRSQKVIKNIILSFGVKAATIVVGLLLVPVTINYISPLEYGIWLTISSILAWMSFFDIGLGNGLRNKLAYAMATNNIADAKKFVSTTYAVLIIISTVLFLILEVIAINVNWYSILNIPYSVTENMHFVISVVFASFSIQFVLQIVNTVLIATHENAMASFITLVGQLLVLIIIYILKRTVPGNLTTIVWALTFAPIFVTILASVYFYRSKLKNIAPSFKSVDFSYAKSIMNLGGVFFVVQIGALILFQTDNIIITKVIGPQFVTQFNVAYKLFSILIMAFTIVIGPYWSAFTDAYAKGDFGWMKQSVKRLRILWLFFSFILTPIVFFCSKYLYSVWIGKAVEVPDSLSFTMAIYSIGYTCLSLSCFFLNGIGKMRLQLILYVISGIINIPIGIVLARLYGTTGVVISNLIIFLVMDVLLWIQVNMILNNSKKTFWIR